MWARLVQNQTFWATAILFGSLLFVGEVALAIFGQGSAWWHLFRALFWVSMIPLWLHRYRKASTR